jgi:hypothetical protein
MTDPNSPSHWDVLASDLGAKPPAKEAEPQPTSPPPSRPIPPKRSLPRTSRGSRLSAAPPGVANWDLIANELGVTPASQPVAPPVEAPVETKAAARSAPAGAEQERRTPPAPDRLPERAEDSPNFFDEPFDFEEPFDLLESSEAPAAVAPPKDSEEAEEPTGPAERHDRKRRRRRRSGRGSERRDSCGPGAPDAAEGRAAPPETESDREPTVEAVEETAVEKVRVETAEGEERRSRRHRSRRGKKRRPDDESAPALAGEPSKQETTAEHAPPRDKGAYEGEEGEEGIEDTSLDEDEQLDDDRPARVGFRGIPTWEEAVGLVITKNMEARSKRPNGGPSKGRGNRGPRDNRGPGDGRRRS